MADLAIADAEPLLTPTKRGGLCGEAIADGDLVARDSTDGKIYLSDANHANAERRKVDGVALEAGAIGDTIQYQTAGSIQVGVTTVVATIYVLSRNAGQMCPAADLTIGDTLVIVGYSPVDGIINLAITNTTAVVAA